MTKSHHTHADTGADTGTDADTDTGADTGTDADTGTAAANAPQTSEESPHSPRGVALDARSGPHLPALPFRKER